MSRAKENKREKIYAHINHLKSTHEKWVCDTEIEPIDIQSKINVPATMTAEQQHKTENVWKILQPDDDLRVDSEKKASLKSIKRLM
jgi:hypothetical protein